MVVGRTSHRCDRRRIGSRREQERTSTTPSRRAHGVASTATVPACRATGKHVKTAELTGAHITGKGKATAFLTYKMSDVLVTAIEHGDADSGPPIEQFTLAYAKIEMTYVPQKSSGKLGTPVHAGFDVKQNKEV